MILEIPVLLSLAALLGTYIVCSIQDIKHRETTKGMNFIFIMLFLIGIVLSIYQYGVTLHLLIILLIPTLLCLCCRVINIIRRRLEKPFLIGGSDIRIFYVSCLIYPLVFNEICSCFIIIPITLLLAILGRFIPRIAKSRKERGIPLIPYLGIGTFIPIFFELIFFIITR